MKAIIKTFILTAFCLYVGHSGCYATPTMRVKDKLLIREAITISNLYGESVWKGIDKIPFVIVLVTDSIEFLVYHPNPWRFSFFLNKIQYWERRSIIGKGNLVNTCSLHFRQ